MKKILGFAGAIALSIIPTPSFSGEVEQKEMMSVTEQLLPQIGEKYKNLDIKEKKAYKEALINYLEDVQKTEATGVGESFFELISNPDRWHADHYKGKCRNVDELSRENPVSGGKCRP